MHMKYDCEIACSPEHLWPYLDEPERQKLWMKGLVENEATSPGPTRVGSTFQMRIKEGRRVQEHKGEVTAYERCKHLGIKIMWGGCLQKDSEIFCDYRLVDRGAHTLLQYEAHGEVKGLLRLLMPIFAMFGRIQLKSFMRTLKALAERDAATGPAPAAM